MPRTLTFERESEEERVKRTGLTLDFDEIAKKGSMSKEDILIAKWYGIYTNRQPGTHMARLTLPGGLITAEQARLIAETSERYAQGKLSITTRQDIQYHWMTLKNLPLILRDLATKGITTFHGCGDVNRNTTACPMAEVCAYRRFDVFPYAREISRALANSRDLDNLPRKFKVNLSGCPTDCAQTTINCVGLIAVTRQSETGDRNGFRALLGGGMGWKAFKAQEVFSFVPHHKAVHFARAAALLFRDFGDRFNRAKSRLKFVVAKKGVEECRRLLLDYMRMENVDVTGFETSPVADLGVACPKRALVDTDCRTDDRKTVLRIMIPKGEMTFFQLAGIADLSEMYGDQRIIATNRQNLELHHIDQGNLEKAKADIERLGLRSEGTNGLIDIVPCVGTTFCPKAVTETRKLYDMIMPVVEKEMFTDIRDKVIVNITGCPNSCSPYRIADIGFRGMRIREEQGSVEAYELLIGGCNEHFGLKLGEFKLSDCPAVTERILETFTAVREEDEALSDTVRRLGLEPFRQGVYYGA
jgi:sulfite reductase beta subunit-like hemoprotein